MACLSNVAFPAWSLAEIRQAILKAFAFGERGLLSSISEKPSQGTPLPPPSELLHVENTDSTNNNSKYTKLHSLRKGLLTMLVLSGVFKTNYSHGICSALYAPIKRSARTRPAVLKHRSSTHTHTLKKKTLFFSRGVWVMSLGLAGEELLRERMSETRAPRLQCTVEKSVHALHGMFYLNRTLSITLPNLNSLARKKEKNKKTSRGCPAVLLQQIICCDISHCWWKTLHAQTLWTTAHQWSALRHSQLLVKWIQLKVVDLSVHSTKFLQWSFATS